MKPNVDESRSIIVVPCFNEAARLDRQGFAAFAADRSLSLLFVDDGSTDGTGQVLGELVADLRARGIDASALALERNGGKGEAVRRGMTEALARGATVVGYYDADLATPPDEMIRLVHLLRERDLDVVIAARIALLGRQIARKAYRHYLGRVFATFASVILDVAVYDTQCGAKVFRRTPALEAGLSRPFVARWAFDVELLGRLLAGAPGAPGTPLTAIAEHPLQAWRDVGGSTLRPRHFPLLAVELMRIAHSLHEWRAAASKPPAHPVSRSDER